MEDIYDIIEKYVNGELSGKELEEFEKKLDSDSALASEVQLFREAKESLADQFIHQEEEAALKETLSQVSAPHFEENKTPKNVFSLRRRHWLAAAGAAAAILALVIFRPWQASLYDQYSQFPLAAFTEQGGANEADLAQAQQAFNQEDYPEALNIFQSYLNEEEHKDDPQIQLYKGLCHLALEEYSQAEAIFQSLQNGNSAYKNDGTWYLAMTFLKQKEWGKVRELLPQIPENSSRRKDAQRLLRKISGKK